MATHPKTAAEAKRHAKILRAELAEKGTEISHARSLEEIAHRCGFRDWNAYLASVGDDQPAAWRTGGRVTGRYLSQPFAATVIAAAATTPGWHQLELELDEAVDVVTSDGFSNFRKRVRGVVGPKGHSKERTGDGVAHLQIDL
ncbi:MAG: glyoxalase superfamily protein [Pseudomonadota bacterium]